MYKYQRTVKSVVLIEGIGLHTGDSISMSLIPVPANTGISFTRVDIEGNPVVKADPYNVVDTSRSTTIQEGEARVQTIEHLLAALFSLGIDNLSIEIDGPEVPILDGSSRPFIDMIEKVGVEDLEQTREYLQLNHHITFTDKEKGIEITAFPADEFSVTCMIDYNSKVLGLQYAELHCIDEFKEEISSSKTFCFFKELEMLAKNNLIKGGNLDNALVVVEEPVAEEKLEELSTLLNKPKIAVTKRGYLNNAEIRSDNEPARHKLLDIVGDMALIGMNVNMRIVAKKPGHYGNTELAKKIKKHLMQVKKSADIPVYDVNKEPIKTLEDIKAMLPHRYPFLFIDKVIDMKEDEVVAIKNVTGNESIFQGHFPGNPVFPGVLMVEAMAQTGGILALSAFDDPHNYDTYFLKIDKCKFKQMVFPGDTLIFKMKMSQPMRRGIVVMSGETFVGNKLVCEAELVAKIQKRNV